MLSELLLISGNDIPFAKGRLTIHQPTMKEIAYIGEEAFFLGSEMLNFSKDILSAEDKSNLSDKSNFEVFMSIMGDRQSTNIQRNRISAMQVLALIFPDYQMSATRDRFLFQKMEGEQVVEEGEINKDNFEDFKEIITQMFCLKPRKDDDLDYNPIGKQATAIAEKLKKGRQKVQEEKHGNQKIAVFSRYISILVVGLQKTFEELNKYTVYQIFDAFERFELKENSDYYFRAKLAGAKDLEEVDNWMKDIHP